MNCVLKNYLLAGGNVTDAHLRSSFIYEFSQYNGQRKRDAKIVRDSYVFAGTAKTCMNLNYMLIFVFIGIEHKKDRMNNVAYINIDV